jgi:hypothetical protein
MWKCAQHGLVAGHSDPEDLKIFWEKSKRYIQLQITGYRYRKKNLSKYFKLWKDQ